MSQARRVSAFFLVLLFLAVFDLRAALRLPRLFSDHAVLQSDFPVALWGWAEPGARVTVSLAGQSVSTEAGPDGAWRTLLAPLPAGGPHELVVSAGADRVAARDILLGEVWLCSGQSNMEWPVEKSDGAALETPAADHPRLRHFKVKRRRSETPLDDVEGQWVVCSSASAGRFTAVGYYFSRDILPRLPADAGLGLIDSTWGGTAVESWMSPTALAADPAFERVGRRWRQAIEAYPRLQAEHRQALGAWEIAASEARAAGRPEPSKPRAPAAPDSPHQPGVLHQAMIAPLVPYTLRGVLWYQGEANAGRAEEYRALFAALIGDWRRAWGREFPFLFVQLPDYAPGGRSGDLSWAFLREAQARTAATVPGTAMAVTLGLGEPGDIHPKNKREVGRRLALLARRDVYGEGALAAEGPRFAELLPGNEAGSLRVRFFTAQGALRADGGPVQAFSLAGEDRVFHPAEATLEGDRVTVRSPAVPHPVAVRYAFLNVPPGATLTDGTGLPAAPFRTDDWPRPPRTGSSP